MFQDVTRGKIIYLCTFDTRDTLIVMKVALVHDYIKEYGGAERVLEVLHEIWPDAPVFTTVYLPEFLGPHKERFKTWDIRTSLAQNIPFRERLISPLRLLSPFLFKQFDFSKFDVVIVSATGAYFPNMIKIKSANHNRQNITHICYCHTPPRYLYGYATAREWKNKIIFRILGELANHFLRLVDFKAAQNVDFFIANSEEVKGRIKKFYRRDSVVIYPPVDLMKISTKDSRQSYYLAGGRLARAKNTDLIVKACEEMGVSLKVFGRGFGGNDLLQGSKLKVQNSNIDFIGEVTDEEKLELMKNAKAYIFASVDEDFGITPVEAMSVGTPIIAYRSGGVKETVIDKKTGLFFDDLTVDCLIKAIKQFNNITINPDVCIKQAEKFSKERFKKMITDFVTDLRK